MIRRKKLLFIVIGCFYVFGLCGCLKRDVKEAMGIRHQREYYKQLNESVGFTDEILNEDADPAKEEELKEQEIITGQMQTPLGKDIDLKSLYDINPDIYAWMYIPGTDISYPVVQSSDDEPEDYYLMHNLDGSYGYPACVYSQKLNKKDFSDRDTILYAHNMNDGTMFAKLHEFKDPDYFNSHDVLYIYTEDKVLRYRLFTSFSYDDTLILDEYDEFNDDHVFQDYLIELSNKGEETDGNVNGSVYADISSRLLTLSTCESDNTKRYLVVFVLENECEY